jgi:hypothetical protein
MDEVLVQHAENDIDRDQRRQDQYGFAGERGLEGLCVPMEARFDRRRRMQRRHRLFDRRFRRTERRVSLQVETDGY